MKKSVADSEKPVKAKEFDKELFKRSVEYNVRTLYRKNLEEADAQQIFQAVSYAIKDRIVENWMETQKAYEKEDPKMVYYMSMEFLMGRALGNNLINLKAYKPVAEALEELGLDLNLIEDQEPDAALGNGGLGRLAACFLDSLATLGYPAYGCGIRYRYGMFKQEIRDGYQVEVPDNWLMNGNPFELRRPEYAKIVKFGGYVSVHTWTSIAKVVRTEVRQLRGSEYILAAKCMGGSFFYILRRHLAPNFLSSIMFMVVMNVRSAMIAESTLSFMGIGLPLEVISWGSMLSLAEKALLTNAWWIVVIPGVFLVVTLLCMTNIGHDLRRRANHRHSNL